MSLALGVLVSGSGTNLQAILDATSSRALDARVCVVVANRADAYALERAKHAGVPTRVIPHADFASREEFDAALVTTLREAGVEVVVLAGFMRVLTPVLLRAFEGRVVNIHPALLPAFPGTRAQEQALRYGVKVTGCTVHFVDEGVDTGPIITQRAVPVFDDDDIATLSARILEQEHGALVEALQWLAEGRLQLLPAEGQRRARVTSGRT